MITAIRIKKKITAQLQARISLQCEEWVVGREKAQIKKSTH